MCITFEWEFSQFIPFDWIVKREHLLEILYHQYYYGYLPAFITGKGL